MRGSSPRMTQSFLNQAALCAAESRGSAMRSENCAPISQPSRQTTRQERREYGPSDITRMNSSGTA